MKQVSRTHRVAFDWLFDRINLDPKNPNQVHMTPRTNSQTYWQREISHVMNGIIFCVCSTSAISVPSIVLKRCRKEYKKTLVKKELQQSQSRWWIWVSRYRVRDPNVLASTASESPVNTKPESQNVPLSSWNVKQTSAVRPVLGASSSNYFRMEHWRRVVFSSVENLVKCRTQVRDIWTLTPPPNRTFLHDHNNSSTE